MEESKAEEEIGVEWNEERIKSAEEVLNSDKSQISQYYFSKFESEAQKHWDIFYKNNKTNFFKDRHYILDELPEIKELYKEKREKEEFLYIVDYGCGVGNAIFPLLQELQFVRIYAFDFSRRAVEFIKEHPDYEKERMNTEILDLVKDPIPIIDDQNNSIPHLGLLIYVLSSISPSEHREVGCKIYQSMGKGGILYFRDYGKYDMAELRFARKGRLKLADNFYIRKDKTRAYYFTIQEVKEIFEGAGFETLECKYIYKTVENRGDKKLMHRVWIQAKFIKSPT